MNVIQVINLKSKCCKQKDKFWNDYDQSSTDHSTQISTVDFDGINQKLLTPTVHRICNGLLVEHDNIYYVITCYHFIKDHNELYASIVTLNGIESVSLREVGSIKQYDFSILTFQMDALRNKPKKNNKKINISLSDIQKSINNPERNKIYLEYVNNVDLENDKIFAICTNVINTNFGSNLYPNIPAISIKLAFIKTNIPISDTDCEGLSGCILSNKDNIYGMVSHYDYKTNNLIVISSYCIEIFFNLIIKDKPLKGLYVKTTLCEFDKNKMGKFITSNYGISYETKEGKKIKLNKNDIIYKLDNNKFDNNGKIIIEKLGIYVNIDTYIMLNNNDYIKIEYYKKKGSEYVNVIEIIEKVNLDMYLLFDFEQKKEFINYNGLIITELSENLYSYYEKINVHFIGMIKSLYENCIDVDYYKPVVIIDVNYNGLSDDTIHMYSKIGLPFIKTITSDNMDTTVDPDQNNQDHYLSIITHFNNDKIIDLTHLKKLIRNDVTNASVFKISVEINKSYELLLNKNNVTNNRNTSDDITAMFKNTLSVF